MGVADNIWVAFGVGTAVFATLIALPIAILIALALIRLFRWRVARSMRAAAGVPQDLEPSAGDGSSGALDVALIETAPTDERRAPSLANARRQSRELAAIHAEAACVYPLVFVFLWWAPSDTGILRASAIFGLFILVLGTPVVFAGMMIFCKQPRFIALAAGALVAVLLAFDMATTAESRLVLYVGAAVPIIGALMLMMLRKEPRLVILVALAIVVSLLAATSLSSEGSRSGTDFVGMWLMVAGVPTVVVVVLNIRRLRAVGPIVFVGMLLLLNGIAAGAAYASLFVANAVDARLVREDLAHLPFFEAMSRLPLAETLATVRVMVSGPASVYRYDLEKMTLWVELLVLAMPVAGAVFGAVAAWAAVRWLAGNYKRRRASDQMLNVDVMMLIFVLPLSVLLTTLPEGQVHGWLFGAIGLASFAAYKIWTRVRLRFWLRRKPPASPRTLLLLRVFGFDRRTQRLLEDVSQRWRYLGPIRLIGGADLAYSTLEPHEFFDFLNGRLSRAFVKDRQDLEGRLTEGSPVPDPDGLYRVEEFFCHDDTWRMTVSRLAQDADAILMDLRGFSPANRGCIFEIEQLIAGVPLDRVVLLADASTDTAFLETTLQGAWHAMPGDSPNASAGPHRVRILKASSRHRRTLRSLLELLCHHFPGSAPGSAVESAVAATSRAGQTRPEAAA